MKTIFIHELGVTLMHEPGVECDLAYDDCDISVTIIEHQGFTEVEFTKGHFTEISTFGKIVHSFMSATESTVWTEYPNSRMSIKVSKDIMTVNDVFKYMSGTYAS